METKLNNSKKMTTKATKFGFLIFSTLFLLPQFACSQKGHYMADLRINSVVLKNTPPNYVDYFSNCKTIEDKTYWDDEIEQNVRQFVVECDSIRIQNEKYLSTGNTYTNVIEVLSSKHNLFYKEQKFSVGTTIEDIGKIFPTVQEQYKEYMKNQPDRYDEIIRLDNQMYMKVEGVEEDVPVQGIKFDVRRGIIVSIIIDFRADGDF